MAIMTSVEMDDNLEIEDEADDNNPDVKYEIATYPSDLTLSVIEEMWNNKDITIPTFQRNFVWNIKQSTLLIESFLLGLPVPQVFFYIDDENKNLVIDGQQRILTIVFFFAGYFGTENLQGRRQVFRLTGLSKESPYFNKRFEDLSHSDQRKLRGSILRAVNVKQLSPANQNTSVYHIFERLNTGGIALKPQEIRNCVFHGGLVTTLHDLNANEKWRKILGRKALDRHQRDVEMILRIFSMSDRGDLYEKPMKEFLNQQMKIYKSGKEPEIRRFSGAFERAVDFIISRLPEKPFHVRGPINLAALDSIMSIVIRNLGKLPEDFQDRYKALLSDKNYQKAIYFNTSDATTVKDRLRIAKQYLID